MSLTKPRLIAWMAAGIMCASVGCNSAPPGLKTEEVEGLITLDGEPVADATVTFTPVMEGVGAMATGMTDAAGKYRLTALKAGYSPQAGSGTLPGEYNVGVLKVKLPDIPTSTEAAKPQDGQRPKDSAMKYVVPQKYENPTSSGIKVTVKEGKNDIPIVLTSK
ncbi:MAG TPA: carboxypeptidase-like regulatory domain-containing protein [Pirellulales bacterium]|nr:carboxypeptidase-like regulatory domain-containing protein [Pirellulales bacterium]